MSRVLGRRSDAGFSLIEVMLAAAILGTAVVALLLVLTRSAETGTDADDLRRLQLLAGERLGELAAGDESGGGGVFEAPYGAWRWRYRRSTETWPGPGDGGEPVELIKHELTLRGPGALTLPPLVRFTADVEEGLDEEGEGSGSGQ